MSVRFRLVGLFLVVVVLLLLSACQQQPTTVTVVITNTPGPSPTPIVERETIVVTATPEPQPTQPAALVFERGETLYTSGTQWGPPSTWNPLITWGYATGTVGLCYETLFLYNPLTAEYIPWLAESGRWVNDTTYELKLREGITWTDGRPFTADDVQFTFELGQKFAGVYFSPLWEWLDSIEKVDDYTLRFSFSDPRYQEWGNILYSLPILPEHLWKDRTEEEVVSGTNLPPVGTGPYLYEGYSEDRMVWVRNEEWWGTKLLGLKPAPKRIVDIVNPSNNVALGLVLKGEVDLSNNFLPGIATLVEGGYGIKTYYPEPPYMLSANTAWLIMNNTRKPMDDPNFRRAMAYAVDVRQIVERVYGNIVAPANPTGLLPVWSDFVDQDVVEELGFSYDPDRARAILAQAGYRDTDGDGFVEAPDGARFQLSIIVPFGWTDWMESIRVIAEGAQAVGINLQPEFPDYSGYADALHTGNFDMAISNEAQMSNTPWTYYNWLFNHPIQETMTSGNYSRYDNPEVFDLVEQLDRVPVDDIEGMKRVISQIQRIQLTDMPTVPLWYNGLWAQYNTTYWTNWPSAEEGAPKYPPSTWRGYWNMGAVFMLTELKPAGE